MLRGTIALALCMCCALSAEAGSIVEVAESTGVHTALVAALQKAGLVSTLEGPGPFTVFAPTDAAFEAAKIDLDSFDTPAKVAQLKDILLYHVHAGKVAASAITDGETIIMGNGVPATLSVKDGAVKINGAAVTKADVMASNGIIHVIDAVLLPAPAPVPSESGASSHTVVIVAAVVGGVAAIAAVVGGVMVMRRRRDGYQAVPSA